MSNSNRVILVDLLRGFALMGIVLIHSVEHFDFFVKPEHNFFFTAKFDAQVINTVFLLISGKAYSIFALMFGFSFFIQMNRQESKGVDFRWRFAWRLTLLLMMGFVHSLFYKGDILHIYALLGLLLIILYRVKTRNLLILAVLLAVQIPLIYNLILSFTNPEYEYIKSFGAGMWQEADKVYASGSFWDVVKFNFWKGRSDAWGWTYYNGRYLQLIALFIVGFVIGRKGYFENIDQYKRTTIKLLIINVFIIILFLFINYLFQTSEFTGTQKELLGTVMKSYTNLAFTSVIVLVFIQLYLIFRNTSWINSLACYGRMSLTNYIIQAIIGVMIFYGYGLGMYRFMGSAWSLLYGILFLSLQIFFSRFWLKRFRYGPFEWIWRVLTFFDFKIKIKRQ